MDDNRKIVLSALYLYQEIDRIDPRVEAVIIPGDKSSLVQWLINHIGYVIHQPKEEPVQIMIVQDEIEEAIRDFVKKKLTVNSGQRITVDLRATRGDEGYTAMIDIVDETSAEGSVQAPQASAPAAAKPAPKAERPVAVTKKATPPVAAKVEAPAPQAEPEVAAAEEAAPAVAEEAVVEEAPAEPAPTKSLFEKVQETATAAPASTEEAPAQEEAPKRPSLFGGQTPPNNH